MNHGSIHTGLLLLSTKSEEQSFWLLKVLVEKILPDYYTRTMDGLIVDIEVLSELVKSKVPDVHQHVINLGKDAPHYNTEKLLTKRRLRKHVFKASVIGNVGTAYILGAKCQYLRVCQDH